MDITLILYLVIVFAVLLGLGFVALNFFGVKKLPEGTEKMQKTAAAIRVGANAFIMYELKIIAIVAVVVAAILTVLVSWMAGIAFLIGAVMSECAGFIGMKIATYANVRVTNAAKETKHIGKTLKVAFRGGSVMGLSVAGFALLGALIVYLVFGLGLGQLADASAAAGLSKNFIGMNTVGLSTTVSGYALGCSLIALFNRVGGGIYTKAADMGADLVGKTEAHIAEDDPRNPATIADNVGDNVGDVAGLGSDLLESFVGAIMSSIILACELVSHNKGIAPTFAKALMLFPIAFAAIGLIACVIGIATLVFKKNISNDPSKVHSSLNGATWLSAGIIAVIGLGLTYLVFNPSMGYNVFTAKSLEDAGFQLGWISPWVTAVIGIAAGIVIGIFAEYYTSYDYKPTRNISFASKEGAALTITQGLALGMVSCMLPVVILGVAILGSYMIGDFYGIGIAAMGMLSFVAATVSVDTYGPISDNAGGIAEMCELEPEVREITDKLDSVGNTTAAIGKGFAIGSAALAALSMMSGYIYEYAGDVTLNITKPVILMGALIGAALPFFFSGLLINAVAKAARKMVDEVRRQFKEIPGLLQGTADPDYETCIKISSKGAISEMKVPAILAIAVPVVTGFIFGAEFVGGLLIGATLSAIMLAIFTGNAGGAWDNAKKFIESGAQGLGGKGSPEHDASVVGDTVGDPLKDTVGPSLDIFIKIMSVVSVVMVVVFSKYNLMEALGITL